MRKLILSLLLAWGVLASSLDGQQPRTPASIKAPAPVEIKSLVDTYCVGCHSERLKSADLVLEHRDPAAMGRDAEVWERVVTKLHAGAMPPVGSRRPDPATYRQLITAIEQELDRASQAAVNPGRPPIHRLNRLEYANAIRDVFGIEVNGADYLPADDSGFGFDNIADVLTMSPGLLDRYLLAATKISRLAVGDPTMRPSVATYWVGDQTLGQDDRMSETLPFGSRGGVALRHFFPLDGEYRVKFMLQRSDVADSNVIRGLDVENVIDVRLDRQRVKTFSVGSDADRPKTFQNYQVEEFAPDTAAEVRFRTTAGTHLVGISFNKDNWDVEGTGPSRLPLTSEAFNIGRVTSREAGRIEMTIQKVFIAGPFDSTMPTDGEVRRRLFVCTPRAAKDEAACARRILSTVARRAYRRPATDAEVTTLLKFYQDSRQDATFEEGIRGALERMLVDVKFLFRLERDPASAKPGASYRISDLELASRLSFFLWSSVPDDKLLETAEQNQLHEPAVLEREVRRMLADPRSSTFVDNFFGQWLLLRNVATHHPNKVLFPDFDEDLRRAFQQETSLFLNSQIRDDRPATELLTADYTFVNERLARHYGLPDVVGSHFRRTTLPADMPRRGLLGQGGVLMVTSYEDRTSVVVRGKYILQNLLGVPPPPPPPNVPQLSETKVEGSLRQRMELHRKNPACATCHNTIDPPGFALENFDAIGKYRAKDGAASIDTSGRLANGATFDGPVAFNVALSSQKDALLNTLTGKLLTYAVGRGVEYYDMPAVRQILRDSAPTDYRWSSLVVAIAKSAPFQMRKAES